MDNFQNSLNFKQRIQSIKRNAHKNNINENELFSNESLLGKKLENTNNRIKNKKILRDSSSRYSLMLSCEIESMERKKK